MSEKLEALKSSLVDGETNINKELLEQIIDLAIVEGSEYRPWYPICLIQVDNIIKAYGLFVDCAPGIAGESSYNIRYYPLLDGGAETMFGNTIDTFCVPTGSTPTIWIFPWLTKEYSHIKLRAVLARNDSNEKYTINMQYEAMVHQMDEGVMNIAFLNNMENQSGFVMTEQTYDITSPDINMRFSSLFYDMVVNLIEVIPLAASTLNFEISKIHTNDITIF